MNTFDLARAYERGACVECSRPGRVVFHGTDSSCPFRGRERSVTCLGASLAESRDGVHQTWNLDRVCDRCRRENRAVVARLQAVQEADDVTAVERRRLAAAFRVGANDRGSSAATPVLSSGPIRPDAAVAPATRTVPTSGRGNPSTGPGMAPSACEPGPVAPVGGESDSAPRSADSGRPHRHTL